MPGVVAVAGSDSDSPDSPLPHWCARWDLAACSLPSGPWSDEAPHVPSLLFPRRPSVSLGAARRALRESLLCVLAGEPRPISADPTSPVPSLLVPGFHRPVCSPVLCLSSHAERCREGKAKKTPHSLPEAGDGARLTSSLMSRPLRASRLVSAVSLTAWILDPGAGFLRKSLSACCLPACERKKNPPQPSQGTRSLLPVAQEQPHPTLLFSLSLSDPQCPNLVRAPACGARASPSPAKPIEAQPSYTTRRNQPYHPASRAPAHLAGPRQPAQPMLCALELERELRCAGPARRALCQLVPCCRAAVLPFCRARRAAGRGAESPLLRPSPVARRSTPDARPTPTPDECPTGDRQATGCSASCIAHRMLHRSLSPRPSAHGPQAKGDCRMHGKLGLRYASGGPHPTRAEQHTTACTAGARSE